MRRSFEPELINYRKRSGGDKSLVLYSSCLTNDLPWQTSGSVAWSSAEGMRLYSDGAYAERKKIIPMGDFSFGFTFKNTYRGSGADQSHFYLGDWDTYGSSYLVAYLRMYSSSDTRLTWAIKTRTDFAYNDAAVFYNCTKYNFYDTYGTWYSVYFEVYNKSYIRIKVNPWGGYTYVMPGAWDYEGPVTNPAGFYPQNGNFGFCSTLTDASYGFYICHINIAKLNWG